MLDILGIFPRTKLQRRFIKIVLLLIIGGIFFFDYFLEKWFSNLNGLFLENIFIVLFKNITIYFANVIWFLKYIHYLQESCFFYIYNFLISDSWLMQDPRYSAFGHGIYIFKWSCWFFFFMFILYVVVLFFAKRSSNKYLKGFFGWVFYKKEIERLPPLVSVHVGGLSGDYSALFLAWVFFFSFFWEPLLNSSFSYPDLFLYFNEFSYTINPDNYFWSFYFFLEDYDVSNRLFVKSLDSCVDIQNSWDYLNRNNFLFDISFQSNHALWWDFWSQAHIFWSTYKSNSLSISINPTNWGGDDEAYKSWGQAGWWDFFFKYFRKEEKVDTSFVRKASFFAKSNGVDAASINESFSDNLLTKFVDEKFLIKKKRNAFWEQKIKFWDYWNNIVQRRAFYMDTDFATLRAYRSGVLLGDINLSTFEGYRDYLVGRSFAHKHVNHVSQERWFEPGGPEKALCYDMGSRIQFFKSIPFLDKNYVYRDSFSNGFNPGRAGVRLFIRQLLLDSYQKLYGRGLGFYYSIFPGWWKTKWFFNAINFNFSDLFSSNSGFFNNFFFTVPANLNLYIFLVSKFDYDFTNQSVKYMVPYEFGHEIHANSVLNLDQLNFLHLNYFGSVRGNPYWNCELFKSDNLLVKFTDFVPNKGSKFDNFFSLRHLDYFSRSFFNNNLFFFFSHEQLLNIEKNAWSNSWVYFSNFLDLDHLNKGFLGVADNLSFQKLNKLS